MHRYWYEAWTLQNLEYAAENVPVSLRKADVPFQVDLEPVPLDNADQATFPAQASERACAVSEAHHELRALKSRLVTTASPLVGNTSPTAPCCSCR